MLVDAVSPGLGIPVETCNATAPTKGKSYLKTSQSVTVVAEGGHSKGSFSVYLHNGKKYISFNNTWVCIQGKSRFSYNGCWYIIK